MKDPYGRPTPTTDPVPCQVCIDNDSRLGSARDERKVPVLASLREGAKAKRASPAHRPGGMPPTGEMIAVGGGLLGVRDLPVLGHLQPRL